MLTSGELPRKLQLALHPINWSETDRDRETIFRAVHDELMAATAAARDELLAKIACHGGVLEHEGRGR